MKDYLIWVKHGEGSSMSYAEANPVHVDGLNMDDGTQHLTPQTYPVMLNPSDDDVGIQNACEDIDESEQAEFFRGIVALLFRSFYVPYQRDGGLEEGSNRAFVQRV